MPSNQERNERITLLSWLDELFRTDRQMTYNGDEVHRSQQGGGHVLPFRFVTQEVHGRLHLKVARLCS